MRCIVWDGIATRPTPWMKIHALHEATLLCEHVLWLDADATPKHPFRFPNAVPKADLVAVHDQNGLNTGIVLITSNAWINETLRVVWERREFLHHPWWEQEALRRSIYDKSVRPVSKVRLTHDFPSHFHHIAGCFSTQPAESCRRKVMEDISSFQETGCKDILLRTHRVTPSSVRPRSVV